MMNAKDFFSFHRENVIFDIILTVVGEATRSRKCLASR